MSTEDRYAQLAKRLAALYAICVCVLAAHHRAPRVLVFAPAELLFDVFLADDRAARFCAALYSLGIALHALLVTTRGFGAVALALEQIALMKSPMGGALVLVALFPLGWFGASWIALVPGILAPLALRRWTLALLRVPLCVVLALTTLA